MLMAYKNPPILEVHSNVQEWVNQLEQGIYMEPCMCSDSQIELNCNANLWRYVHISKY